MNEIKSKDSRQSPKKSQNCEKIFTSIPSGRYKGKKLLLPSLESTRSTKSIVCACVFNVLRETLRDKIFIEAFGGSALMAACALSNYALRAYAIELDDKAYRVALENAKILDENLSVLHGDSFELLPKLLRNIDALVILYFDPPFNIREGFADIYEKIYALLNGLDLSKISAFVIEHHKILRTPEILSGFKRIKLKKFGSTSLSFYERP